MAQVGEHLPIKCKAKFKSQHHKRKKKKANSVTRVSLLLGPLSKENQELHL
jgi:hypothetical protein